MCLGIPGKIVETYEANSLPMGKIDFGGVVREVCLAYVPEASIGDYAVVHVGFAISQLSEEEALKVAHEVGITEFIYEQTPESKASYINELHHSGKSVVMVGDGVNDILALASSDIGIGMPLNASRSLVVIGINIGGLFLCRVLRRV